jgi:hypothetical protein
MMCAGTFATLGAQALQILQALLARRAKLALASSQVAPPMARSMQKCRGMHTKLFWLTCFLFSCESIDSIPAGGPRGLRASDDVEIAKAHQRLAEALNTSQQDTSERYRQVAASHLRMADELQRTYQSSCRGLSRPEAQLSPLYRYSVGGSRTEDGVAIDTRPTNMSPQAMAEQITCHQSWMMLAPADMEDCPLDLPGINVEVRSAGDALRIDLPASSPAMVQELARRVEATSVGVPSLPPNVAKREPSARFAKP